MNLKNLKTNDLLVMPGFGVGQCRGWQAIEIDGCQHEMLSIYFYTQKFIMRLPKAKLAAFSVRALASLDEVAEAFAILKIKKIVKSHNWRKFVAEYNLKMNSGELKKLAVVIRDTLPNTQKSKGADQCKTDIHNAATELFANELMFIQNITHTQALEKIQKAVNLSSSTQK